MASGAGLLRHRSLDTVKVYARVDSAALRAYTIADGGNYSSNWGDQLDGTPFDTGLAMSGVTVGGTPIRVPGPAELGLLLAGGFVVLRRRSA